MDGFPLTHQWKASMVVGSYAVSVLGAYTTTQLMCQSASSHRLWKKLAWIGVASVSFGGTAIWAMHFVSMLAMNIGIPVQYDVTATIASALIAIAATFFAFSYDLLTVYFRRERHKRKRSDPEELPLSPSTAAASAGAGTVDAMAAREASDWSPFASPIGDLHQLSKPSTPSVGSPKSPPRPRQSEGNTRRASLPPLDEHTASTWSVPPGESEEDVIPLIPEQPAPLLKDSHLNLTSTETSMWHLAGLQSTGTTPPTQRRSASQSPNRTLALPMTATAALSTAVQQPGRVTSPAHLPMLPPPAVTVGTVAASSHPPSASSTANAEMGSNSLPRSDTISSHATSSFLGDLPGVRGEMDFSFLREKPYGHTWLGYHAWLFRYNLTPRVMTKGLLLGLTVSGKFFFYI